MDEVGLYWVVKGTDNNTILLKNRLPVGVVKGAKKCERMNGFVAAILNGTIDAKTHDSIDFANLGNWKICGIRRISLDLGFAVVK